MFFNPDLVSEEMVTRYHELQLRPGSRAASIVRYALPKEDVRIRDIARIKAPTLILWGENDRQIPVADAHAFVSAIPDSQVRIYPGVGHHPISEATTTSATDAHLFPRGRR